MDTSNPLTLALIAAGSAILATLLTIIVSPTLQHYFWKRQQREGVRLTAINEVNRLAAEFITKYMAAEREKTMYVPDTAFFQSLQAVTAQVKALFSDGAFRIFEQLTQAIGPNLEQVPGDGHGSVEEYVRRRDAALRALYQDVGIVPRD